MEVRSFIPCIYLVHGQSNKFWELTQLSHLKCIRLGSVRSSHLPFKMHEVGYVRLSLPILMQVRVATPIIFICPTNCQFSNCTHKTKLWAKPSLRSALCLAPLLLRSADVKADGLRADNGHRWPPSPMRLVAFLTRITASGLGDH